ncbi:uncharacterized protein METZ01_LOCUS162636 [marine metagenome]|uniref:Chalcone isomerase domain-containing protein n=1 Tax=marine metagenome TaxID=408172 RepID=A0A382B912_9ZZZZ
MPLIKGILKGTRILATFALVSASLFVGVPAFAATCPDVKLPAKAMVGETNLVLNGIGLRKATFFSVKVYVAGLYLPQKSGDAEQILATDQSWQLVLHFVRDVDSDDIHDALAEGFENATDGKVEAILPQIDAINTLVPDLKVGDRLTFTHEAGRGISVNFNNSSNGAVDGTDLAATLLAIWLGEEPPNEDLKTGLLGGECE